MKGRKHHILVLILAAMFSCDGYYSVHKEL